MKNIWIAGRALTLAAALALLPGCFSGQKARHQALCGKATLQLYYNLQQEWIKGRGHYATFIEQLQMDPPPECRDDWYYDLKVPADGKSFVVSVEQRSVHETYTIDEKGFLREPAENAALLKGKN